MFKNMSYYEDESRFDIEPYYDMAFMNKWEGEVFNHYDLETGDLFNIPVGPCNKLLLLLFVYLINLFQMRIIFVLLIKI